MPRDKQYTVEEIQNLWNDYIEHCKNFETDVVTNSGKVVRFNKGRIPTLGEFQSEWLDIHHSTWELYRDYEGYIATIKKIDEVVKNKKIASLVNGEGNTTGLIFDLKVNYGMNEKTIIDANITNLPVTILTNNTPPLPNE